MKRRHWILALSVVLVIAARLRALFAPPSSLLRPPLSEAELGF